MSAENRAQVVERLVGMITEVIGDEHFAIEPSSSFREELGFESIQFVALAELIQDHWVDLDFVAWFSTKEVPELLALRVGDVADFIVSSSSPS